MTKMQNILTLETNKYSIKLNNFEGPLDLLCHLIDKNKMDIYDINLSEITDQYIEFLNQMEQMNLEVTSEFLVMSSTLLYLKSKHLLPKVDEEEEEITENAHDPGQNPISGPDFQVLSVLVIMDEMLDQKVSHKYPPI